MGELIEIESGTVFEPVETEIISLHNEIIDHLRQSLEAAIRIGELLTMKKAKLHHGQWTPWLDKLPFSDQTARNYMRVYEHREDLKIKNVLNLSEAYKLLIQPEKVKEIPYFEEKKSQYYSEMPKFTKFIIDKDGLTEHHAEELYKLKDIYPPDLMAEYEVGFDYQNAIPTKLCHLLFSLSHQTLKNI